MKSWIMFVGIALVACGVIGVSSAMAGDEGAAAPKTMSAWVCPDCHTMALQAGKCVKCGKDMKEMHVLGTKDGEAMVCGCGADCKCDATKMKDGKCGCGKEVMKASAKGMYVCADGCPEISNKPGKCMCGKEMKKVE